MSFYRNDRLKFHVKVVHESEFMSPMFRAYGTRYCKNYDKRWCHPYFTRVIKIKLRQHQPDDFEAHTSLPSIFGIPLSPPTPLLGLELGPIFSLPPCFLTAYFVITTGLKPCKCEICGSSFSQPCNLLLHIASVHKDQIAEQSQSDSNSVPPTVNADVKAKTAAVPFVMKVKFVDMNLFMGLHLRLNPFCLLILRGARYPKAFT
ncbi:hypothetical protein ACTXT7_007084 [Hymenolepis weldensis]